MIFLVMLFSLLFMLFRRSVLEMGVVVGEGSAIGESTRVNKSVIGSHCKIGDNVTITDAYIWNNVTIKVCLIGSGLKSIVKICIFL